VSKRSSSIETSIDRPADARGPTRAIVVCPYIKKPARAAAAAGDGRSPEAKLTEAAGLAEAIFVEVAARMAVPLEAVRPSTHIGAGKLAEIAERVRAEAAGLVIVDTDLTPVQQRNLERDLGAKVIDRTGLILEIFGERARTKEGELQVELAHLTYQRSRLVRSWTHLERQRGGYGFMGGPGERQIEKDRRMITDRIAQLRRELESVTKTRGLHRRNREQAELPVVAFVGYTNAGKSTLFNRLTASQVSQANMLFATLDPTMRGIELPGGRKAVLSDTVGFIADLPTQLVAAFRATLEEVLSADVILHVRDASHPESAAQAEDVYSVLAELGIDERAADAPPIIEAMNKIDPMPEEEREALFNRAAREERPVAISAQTGEGMADLKARLAAVLGARDSVVELDLEPTDGARLSWLHEHGEVLAQETDEQGTMHLSVRLDPVSHARLMKAEAKGDLV